MANKEDGRGEAGVSDLVARLDKQEREIAALKAAAAAKPQAELTPAQRKRAAIQALPYPDRALATALGGEAYEGPHVIVPLAEAGLVSRQADAAKAAKASVLAIYVDPASGKKVAIVSCDRKAWDTLKGLEVKK